MTQTFYVSGIFETVGTKFGLNIGCDFDANTDMCYGLVVTSQQTVAQFLSKHQPLYNYLILDDIIDGIPTIRLIRRAVGADLEIDTVVKQSDCIPAGQGAPAINFSRVDPMALPRQVELQYVSWDRNFAINTQYAVNQGAKAQQSIMSVQCDFILDDATARTLAYDLLFRIWSQQLSLTFEHPDLTIEPSDIVQVNADQGSFVVQITTSMITKEPMDNSGIGRTNQLTGQLLLPRRSGVTVSPGQVSTVSSTGAFHTYSNPTISFVGEQG